jgi:hypothetical protein
MYNYTTYRLLKETEQRHNLYFSPNIITMIETRKMRQTGRAVHMEKITSAYTVLALKCEENSSLGRPCRRWCKDNKTDLNEVGRVWTGFWIGAGGGLL